MGTKLGGKSHVVAWAVAVLAVPVLYVATFPPLLLLPKWSKVPGSGSIHRHPWPPWARHYVRPWVYLENETMLSGPLDSYLTLWEEWLKP